MLFLCWPGMQIPIQHVLRSELKSDVEFPISTVGALLQSLVLTSIVAADALDFIATLFPLMEEFTTWFHHVILVLVKG